MAPRIIAVGGGKGGVGKSLLAANLGVILARSGIRTVLFDGDLGCANLHTLLGVRGVGANLSDVVDHRLETLEDALLPTSVHRLSLIRGATATPGLANLGHGQKQRLLRQLRKLSAEVVIVDVGAGVSFNTLDLYASADSRVVVTTPQLTSLENAYGFLKASLMRDLQRRSAALKCEEVLSPLFQGQENSRLTQILAEVALEQPLLADALRHRLANYSAVLFGNHVFEESERSRFAGLARMTRDFLGISLSIGGWLAASRAIHNSVSAGEPFVLRGRPVEAVDATERLAEMLLDEPLVQYPEDDELDVSTSGTH